MKTLTVTRYGSLQALEAPLPPLPAGRVRVQVRYAGVGFADLMAVRGGYPFAPRPPFSPGYEFFGRVSEAGPGVPGFAAGQRVAGLLPKMAGYREFLDLAPGLPLPVPDGVSDETAALLPLNYLTALALIERKAKLKAGQSFLIHGAAGGVGTAALELARLFGLTAYGTASLGKRALVAELGGLPLDSQGDWVEELRRLKPLGVEAAFDAFGVASLERSFRTLAKGGILVGYGFSPTVGGGAAPMVLGLLSLAAKQLMPNGRRAAVCGTPGIASADPAWYRDSLGRILAWAAASQVRPLLHSVLPWRQAAEAHAAIASRGVRGKILLDFSPA